MFDAVVLAGGSARRLGGAAKPQLYVGDRTLLDRAVDAVAVAQQIVVVGPAQPVGREVIFSREEPPGGGPVAALAAGLTHTAAECVVVLAADLPWIAPAVPALLAACPAAGVAVLADATGRRNPLAAAWHRATLLAALAELGEPGGASMRDLFALVASVVAVPDPAGWGQDCDTWDDLAGARSHRKDG